MTRNSCAVGMRNAVLRNSLNETKVHMMGSNVITKWHIVDNSNNFLFCSLANRPFYSCVLSYLAMYASEAGGDLALIQIM